MARSAVIAWGLLDGNAASSVLRCVGADAQFHACGRAMQREPAGADPRDPATGARAWRPAVPPRAGQHAPVRARPNDAALPAVGRGKRACGPRSSAGGETAGASDADDRNDVYDRSAADL